MRKDNPFSFKYMDEKRDNIMKTFNSCKHELFRKNWKFMYLLKARTGKCNPGFLMVAFMLTTYKTDN